MVVIAFILGLSVGLALVAPTLRRMRTARAAAEAARALERSTQVELCVVRERHAGEVAGLRRSHDDELNSLRGRFGLEVRMLREAVTNAREELERNGSLERLVTQVAATVERVERELRRIDRRPRAKRR
jgi:putative heme iron utilization protein